MPETYPVTDSLVKQQGVLYPIKYSYVRKNAPPPSQPGDFSFVIYGDSYVLNYESGDIEALNFSIEWGDGTESVVNSIEGSQRTHTYPYEQEWTIIVKSYISGFISFEKDTKLQRVLTPFPENNRRTSFAYCFQGCTSLLSIPLGLFDKNPNALSFFGCFQGCGSLLSIPPGLFDNNKKVQTFFSVFSQCDSITSIPSGLFAHNSEATVFTACFFRCSALTAIPGNLFANCHNATDFESTFIYCHSLSSIPEQLFANNSKAVNFAYCFFQTRNLSNINITFHPDVLAGKTDYTYMFETQYTSYSHRGLAPDLWNSVTNAGARTTRCFRNNESLDNYSSIPGAWR